MQGLLADLRPDPLMTDAVAQARAAGIPVGVISAHHLAEDRLAELTQREREVLVLVGPGAQQPGDR